MPRLSFRPVRGRTYVSCDQSRYSDDRVQPHHHHHHHAAVGARVGGHSVWPECKELDADAVHSSDPIGVVAAIAGKLFINGSESLAAVLAQAVAGGAILALVTHAMIPEALHKGGSGIVLPAVGGFLFALYLALVDAVPT